MKTHVFDYRYAQEILASVKYKQCYQDITDVLGSTIVPKFPVPHRRTRGGKTRVFTTNQVALNAYLVREFGSRGWEISPEITQNHRTRLRADFKKERVQVEVQFGNMARWYTDVFKFQVSYSLGHIDVGVLIVPTHQFANTIDENVAYYERVCRELPYAKMSITLPILVVGIEPET